MRSIARFAAPAIALLLVPVWATPAAPAPAVPQATATGEIQVYNVSLRLVSCTNDPSTACTDNWKDYFRRLAEKSYKPDVLSVLEVPFSKKDAVVNQLAAATNTSTAAWATVHSDKGVTCPNLMHCGNSMIVFRTNKFVQLEPGDRFVRYEMVTDAQGDKYCAKGVDPYRNSRDVAVKLQEKDSNGNPISGRVVVAAALHFPPDLSCMQDSSDWVQSQIDKGADMTIATGDFNRTASGNRTGDLETKDERREICPGTWYKDWSLPQATTDPACATGFVGTFLDAVRAQHPGDDICQEWTVWNTNPEPDPGTCRNAEYQENVDNKWGKRRIDFVWVQRVAGGTAVAPNVVSAGTDRGYYQNGDDWSGRYSDHRALEALIRF
ncbi:MAG TPA: hypothetical protein VHN37_05235 [Actinomycetota bacterium]|nr:hypothetical protein [Actinomycetota bacterium]